jgi:hypothetical protein
VQLLDLIRLALEFDTLLLQHAGQMPDLVLLVGQAHLEIGDLGGQL